MRLRGLDGIAQADFWSGALFKSANLAAIVGLRRVNFLTVTSCVVTGEPQVSVSTHQGILGFWGDRSTYRFHQLPFKRLEARS